MNMHVLFVQLTVLEEGDGPSITSDEPDEEDDTTTTTTTTTTIAATTTTSASPSRGSSQSASTEDLSSAKKKPPPSRISGSGLRAPTAGKREQISPMLSFHVPHFAILILHSAL